MKKVCERCGKQYSKPKKFSKTQWAKSRYCSLSCFGETKRGAPLSEDTKKKLSAAHTGTQKPWAGKYKHTEEHNGKISAGVLAKFKENPEIRAAISEANTGRKMSAEARKNMSAARKQRDDYRGGEKTRAERRRFYEKARRARKFENGGTHTLDEWEKLKEGYSYTCPRCGRQEPEINLTEDHIVPLTRGGTDDISNIQPLCFSCNSSKRTKVIRYEKIELTE